MPLTKKLKLIYNPHSGNKTFQQWLHECALVFQEAGYETHLFCTMAPGDVAAHIAAMPKGVYDAIAVSGGDGTLNIAASALLDNGHDIPLLPIPSGTANDFATFLKIPKDAQEAAALVGGAPIPCDVGQVNERHFLNVCAAGLLANISQAVAKDLKDSFGKLAYYLTGLGRLSNLTPLPVRVTNSSGVFEEEIYLFLALNSSGTGGLLNLAPAACLDDGLFDCILVKAAPLMDLAMLMLKLPSGEHLNDPNIIYFQDSYVKIEPLFDDEQYLGTDIDGEAGPRLPIVIQNKRRALKVFGGA